eukprot:1161584-Pelagomonas_calceolata.AAC.7
MLARPVLYTEKKAHMPSAIKTCYACTGTYAFCDQNMLCMHVVPEGRCHIYSPTQTYDPVHFKHHAKCIPIITHLHGVPQGCLDGLAGLQHGLCKVQHGLRVLGVKASEAFGAGGSVVAEQPRGGHVAVCRMRAHTRRERVALQVQLVSVQGRGWKEVVDADGSHVAVCRECAHAGSVRRSVPIAASQQSNPAAGVLQSTGCVHKQEMVRVKMVHSTVGTHTHAHVPILSSTTCEKHSEGRRGRGAAYPLAHSGLPVLSDSNPGP